MKAEWEIFNGRCCLCVVVFACMFDRSEIHSKSDKLDNSTVIPGLWRLMQKQRREHGEIDFAERVCLSNGPELHGALFAFPDSRASGPSHRCYTD